MMKYIPPKKMADFMDIGKFVPSVDYRSRTYARLYTTAVLNRTYGLKNSYNGYKKPSYEKEQAWEKCKYFKNKHGGMGERLYILQSNCWEYTCGYKITYEGQDYIVVFTRTNRFVVMYNGGGEAYAR